MRQLNKSKTIPFAFRVYTTYNVDHRLANEGPHILVDSLNSDLWSAETSNGKMQTKERFAMMLGGGYGILEAIAKIFGTADRLHSVTSTGDEVKAEGEAAEVKEEARRGPFRFGIVGIEPGATLTFINDDVKTAEVMDDRRIRFNGEVASLAAILLGDENKAVSGSMFWMCQGKWRSDIRNEMGL